MVYRQGKNANHVRFREQDMEAFAASFVGAPFLRNHDTADIGSRDGTVIASSMQGGGEGAAMRQTIRLTTPRGMRDFLTGIIDRFSIGWYWEAIECSVCGEDWLACPHQAGRTYRIGGRQATCELIFIHPRGKRHRRQYASVPDTYVLRELVKLKENRPMNNRHSEPISGDLAAGRRGETRNPGRAGGGGATARLEEPAGENSEAHCTPRVEEMIAASGLPAAAQTVMRLACAGRSPAGLQPDPGPAPSPGGDARPLARAGHPAHHRRGYADPQDRLQHAVDWLFGVRNVDPPPPSLRSIRDIYQAITGDHNWYGVFNREWSQLAAATSTTLAGMVVDALNRVVRMHYDNMTTYRWYEPLVAVTPHAGTTHDLNLVMVDGVANLPVVAEGAAYTEASVGDSKESMSFTKYGHYVGITLETIRKSDIQRIQAIPRELVSRAAHPLRRHQRPVTANGHGAGAGG